MSVSNEATPRSGTTGRRVRVERVAPDVPALEIAQLERLAGATPDEHRQNRGMLLSFAESFENEQYIASVWEGDALEGIATAFLCLRPDGSTLLKVWFPGLFRREGAPKFFYADPAEASRVTRELIEAFVEHARSVGASFVALSHCPTSDRVVANVAEALAFRTLAAPDAFIIQLAEPTSFEAYLNRLSQTRRGDFRRDLRRAAKAGAHMIEETVARPETLERSWPLHVALSMRKGNDYRLGGTSLFDAFQRWLKPADLRVEACYSGDEFAGALIMHIAGTEMHAGYICHRPELEWQVYTAIIATAIERAISRGTTAVHLGFGNDYQKTRLGADALPHVSYVLPLTRR